MDGAGIREKGTIKAACPLEGGALSNSSTCGVVSGGCLAIALARSPLIESGGERAVGATYREMREYTSWFADEFGSTLCRERTGVRLDTPAGFLEYLFTGRPLTRCARHAGAAASRLLRQVTLPLEMDGDPVAGGYCGAPVLQAASELPGGGSGLQAVSVALDGGIGLSGGLCGALAASLMLLGVSLGIDPRTGLVPTLAAFFKGHLNMYGGRDAVELWSAGGNLVRDFASTFGSLECGEITGLTFETAAQLQTHMAGSSACEEIIRWLPDRIDEIRLA